MRSMRSRVPEKSELAAQLKRYRYDAGLKGDEAGAVIGKKATTVYKYEAGTLWVSPADLRSLLNEYGVNMVTAFTEIGDPRAGGRKKDESALQVAQDADLLRHDEPGQAEDPARRREGDGRGLLSRARAHISTPAYMRMRIYL